MLKKRNSFLNRFQWIGISALIVFLIPQAYASGGNDSIAMGFLWIAVFLLLAKASSLIEKWGQPAVLGELVMGVILGNLVLFGIGWFESVKHDPILFFLAELGVVVLLFQIGLESNIQEMRKVGLRAFWVAILGVVTPFVLGYYVGMWLMPGLDTNAYLFLGATLTATSVGITGRVFRDLGKLQTREAQIVLGAAVIDDVMGLIILAVVIAIVKTGAVSTMEIGTITAKAFIFLVGALFLGQLLAPYISRFFSLIHTGVGMKFTIAISFCLIFAYLAYLVHLAPIVGAFAAGLMLVPVHFKAFDNPAITTEIETAVKNADTKTQKEVKGILDRFNDHHVDRLVEPLGHFLVPLFFIMTGLQVNLETLFDLKILGIALVITIVAFIGKLVSGLAAGSVNKWIVGWGMAPRGEVGLIFAMIGKQLGVVSEEVFSVIIIMVILTTLLTPPILNYLLRKQQSA
ncbi:cation:proton antiporter [Candidatus Parabeggiatoa sp. HSG14]|uniref:cation:proton antiporter n=1 Tax=Candidatus Parabeggiatoa sp. HSG14 TaxID=3055593 RepID=UPI0025A8FE13|nr:cation:proton antiporter [Thiotrichales bacterium HSG14]